MERITILNMEVDKLNINLLKYNNKKTSEINKKLKLITQLNKLQLFMENKIILSGSYDNPLGIKEICEEVKKYFHNDNEESLLKPSDIETAMILTYGKPNKETKSWNNCKIKYIRNNIDKINNLDDLDDI